jgi:hypothetical protein
MHRLAAIAFVLAAPAIPVGAQSATRGFLADSALTFLTPLVGAWHPLGLPDSIARLDPPVVGHSYQWTVGRKAMQLREIYRLGSEADAQLQGMVYWNPASERVEFVAVAGHGPGEGRLFTGEYRQLSDGSIERTYDVFYRTAADTPGDHLGGSRRRYREVYRFGAPDSIAATLEWFHGGEWRPFGGFARHSFKRIPGSR